MTMDEGNNMITNGTMQSIAAKSNTTAITLTCAHCYFPGSEVRFSCGCSAHAVRCQTNVSPCFCNFLNLLLIPRE